ncbi:MAG: DUF2288 domain-containing protein [Gammaproteobacteria bacterium]|nr:DUF2288 domain-containing protein [Gammaproteobacteria bacterium]
MNDTPDPDTDPRTRLLQEAGVIIWPELIRHFARGVVIAVDAELDLIEVAQCMADDDTEKVTAWLNQGQVQRASDDMARDWTEREPEFMCVVTAPWVLVQERTPSSQLH